MKKLTVFLMIIASQYGVIAQSSFDKYEDMKEVSSVVVTSKMFKLLSKLNLETDDPEIQEYVNLVDNIENIKVFSTKDKGVGTAMKADVKKYLGSASLEELMRVKSDGKNVKFYSKPGKNDDFVSELFMFLEGSGEGQDADTVVLSITGNIDLKQVSKIADHLNVPGGQELKKVKKQ